MISLCITTYNRFDLLMESFAQVLNDDRISEIVIVDDCSTDEIYGKVLAAVFEMPKVRLHRNQQNLGMSFNKRRAIELAKEDWCIIFDSDNIIGSDYLDAIYVNSTNGLGKQVIYCPQFARPQFDYRLFSGMHINNNNAKEIVKNAMGECLFNTCNYLVNREEYLRCYNHQMDLRADMRGTDTIHFNYQWLSRGNEFYVVPGLEYFHRIHNGSGFLQDVGHNMKKAKEVKELIKLL